MIAPTAIIRGLGMTIGLDIIDVEGATGDEHSNINNKFIRANDLLVNSEYKFGFLHIKAIDDMGHDKTINKRVTIMERIDGYINDFMNQVRD
mmetsp:Transcript_7843/g.1022  ORF Transcript_7843/g.1022 Transcript_7843/m.1022 type:complete len:92 (+) Transcript_7843:749-1024(+)